MTKEFADNYAKMGDVFVAVSSATAEDLPGASFAGRQATFLNVKERKNFLSGFGLLGFFVYRSSYLLSGQNGFDHSKVFIAVVVQRWLILLNQDYVYH